MECYLSEADRLALPTWWVTHASNFKSAPHDKHPTPHAFTAFWTLIFLYCCCCCLFFFGREVLRHPSFVCCITMGAPLPPKWVQIKRKEEKKWLECNPFKFTYISSLESLKITLTFNKPKKEKRKRKKISVTSETDKHQPAQHETRSRYPELFLDNWTPPPRNYLFFPLVKRRKERRRCFSWELSPFLVSVVYLGFRPTLLWTFFQTIRRVRMASRYEGKFFFFLPFCANYFKPSLVALALPCYVLYYSLK